MTATVFLSNATVYFADVCFAECLFSFVNRTVDFVQCHCVFCVGYNNCRIPQQHCVLYGVDHLESLTVMFVVPSLGGYY